MSSLRLGDVIDDYCVKCRRLTNHAIVSLLDGQASKVRCRTCYHDHDYRHEQPPPSKKDLKKAELFNQVLAGSGAPDASGAPAPAVVPVDGIAVEPAAVDAIDPAAVDTIDPAAVDTIDPETIDAIEPATVAVETETVPADAAEAAPKKRARKSTK